MIYASLDEVTAEALSEILYGFIYLTTFIAPALIFRAMAGKREVHPLKLLTPFGRTALPYLFLAIAVGFACSNVSSMIITLIEIPESAVPSIDSSVPMTALQFFLAVFTTAIVPAVCEEFLFRSTVLEHLLPYGKGFAIFTSALLFGLMHQNFFQLFYTTMAGLILGWAYCKTRSYLCVFLIHFCNNFTSVLQELALSNLSEDAGTLVYFIIESAMLVLGILSVIAICIKEKKDKDIYADGSFGRVCETSFDYKEKQITLESARTFFRSPTVMIYTIMIVLSLVAQILSIIFPAA